MIDTSPKIQNPTERKPGRESSLPLRLCWSLQKHQTYRRRDFSHMTIRSKSSHLRVYVEHRDRIRSLVGNQEVLPCWIDRKMEHFSYRAAEKRCMHRM